MDRKRGNCTSSDKAKSLRRQIDEQIDQLARAVDEVRASDVFSAYLDVQSRFHRYSWHNSLLILSQRPEASNVAGFGTWKKLGRHVKKGERGIMIFAPCTWKREVEQPDGTTDEQAGIYFKPVYVFDVSQTDGKELPTVDVPTINAESAHTVTALESVISSRGFRLSYEQLDGPNGYTDKTGRIVIQADLPTGHKAHTLAHELAHQSLHFDKTARPDQLTRQVAELEAEAVAYVVCRHFGIDADVCSSRYIAVWHGDGKGLRTSLERIATTARDIIDDARKLTEKAVA